ncbi:MAG: hypothetical protein WKF36_07095 [Candidatus Nitrosocosmicus sp.]
MVYTIFAVYVMLEKIAKRLVVLYLPAEIICAILGSRFVKYVIGSDALIGANSPNYAYPLPLLFSLVILASALLTAAILVVVYTKGLRGFGKTVTVSLPV